MDGVAGVTNPLHCLNRDCCEWVSGWVFNFIDGIGESHYLCVRICVFMKFQLKKTKGIYVDYPPLDANYIWRGTNRFMFI